MYAVKSFSPYFLLVPASNEYQLLCSRIVRLLREERERQGLSKYAIEQRAGVSQQMVGYVERGLRKPSLEVAIRIASALSVQIEDVIRQARASQKQSRK